MGLDQAVALTRTDDLWLFRGRSAPDRAIQMLTNSPVNHVGMAVVLDDRHCCVVWSQAMPRRQQPLSMFRQIASRRSSNAVASRRIGAESTASS